MPKITATAYIWYPHGGQVGHASLRIGDPADLHYDGLDSTESYVSWWPAEGQQHGLRLLRADSQQKTYFDDQDEEGGLYHVKYDLYGLDVYAMQEMWEAIRDKEESHYKFIDKNCSTIVSRILKTGGAHRFIPFELRFMLVKLNVVWKPKDIATWCDHMVRAGRGEKIKSPNCPQKRNAKFWHRALRMR